MRPGTECKAPIPGVGEHRHNGLGGASTGTRQLCHPWHAKGLEYLCGLLSFPGQLLVRDDLVDYFGLVLRCRLWADVNEIPTGQHARGASWLLIEGRTNGPTRGSRSYREWASTKGLMALPASRLSQRFSEYCDITVNWEGGKAQELSDVVAGDNEDFGVASPGGAHSVVEGGIKISTVPGVEGDDLTIVVQFD